MAGGPLSSGTIANPSQTFSLIRKRQAAVGFPEGAVKNLFSSLMLRRVRNLGDYWLNLTRF
jgi:hypothetical protein